MLSRMTSRQRSWWKREDAVRQAVGTEVEDAVVGSERGPFCVGGGPGELVVRRGLDVHADGREDADDVPCARTVRTDVGHTKTAALSKQLILFFAKK